MKLRQPCEHGRYDDHPVFAEPPISYKGLGRTELIPKGKCPGGVFLPDDTLIVEKVDAEKRVGSVLDEWWPDFNDYAVKQFTAELLDALSVREST